MRVLIAMTFSNNRGAGNHAAYSDALYHCCRHAIYTGSDNNNNNNRNDVINNYAAPYNDRYIIFNPICA